MKKQKLIHGEEDVIAMLRKEEVRDYDRVREWKGMEEEGRERKGRGGKMRRDYIRQESILAPEVFLVSSSSLHESFLDFTQLFNIYLPLVYLTCFHKFLFFLWNILQYHRNNIHGIRFPN